MMLKLPRMAIVLYNLDLQSEFGFTHCHAPSIDGTDRRKRADCLTPPQGGGVSARSGRVGDAQD